LAGESQEPDSLSDVEACVLEQCASIGDDATRESFVLVLVLATGSLVGKGRDGVCEHGKADGKVLHGVDCSWRIFV
jgi:hypothetical protein